MAEKRKSMRQESMRVLYACDDEEIIWMIDEMIYGLYAVDKWTFQTKCVVEFSNLFRYGTFKPYGIFKWKENYIVIIPFEIHKRWVIYDKTNGQIIYKNVVNTECQCTLAGICEMNNRIYFCPAFVKDPIIIVDLDSLTCNQIIKNWCEVTPAKNGEVGWKGIHNEKYMFFPLRDTQILVRMDQDSKKVSFITLDIPERIADIDCYSGELWILPMEGSQLYQIDENGTVIDRIKLERDGQVVSVSEFARLVVQKKYLFLLPWRYHGIWVYEKSKKEISVIGEKNDILTETYKTQAQYFRYYGYYLESNKIYFLPWRNKCVCVDLDSLAYEQKDIFYPIAWTEEEYEFGYNWNLSMYDFYLQEKEKYSFKILMDFTKRKEDKLLSNNPKNFGESLWKVL